MTGGNDAGTISVAAFIAVLIAALAEVLSVVAEQLTINVLKFSMFSMFIR